MGVVSLRSPQDPGGRQRGVWSFGLRSGQEEGSAGGRISVHPLGRWFPCPSACSRDTRLRALTGERTTKRRTPCPQGLWPVAGQGLGQARRELWRLRGHSEDVVQEETGGRGLPGPSPHQTPPVPTPPPSCLLPRLPRGSMLSARLPARSRCFRLVAGSTLSPEAASRACLPLHAPESTCYDPPHGRDGLYSGGVREGAGDTWAVGPVPRWSWVARQGWGQVRGTEGDL